MRPPALATTGAYVFLGDCLDVLAEMPDDTVDAVVTDPPYDLTSGGKGGFMGKAWDGTGIAFRPEVWLECYRVLKPGGHLLAFGGSRTWHRLAVAIEDAGFEMRDSIAWLYGSGFPKSLDVSKAIDKAAGARLVVGEGKGAGSSNTASLGACAPTYDATAPATPDALKWQGYGTALKPAFEPIVVARKPLTGTVAANVLAHGTGALNVDGCRVGNGERPVMVRTSTTVAASSMSGESTGATSNGEMTTAGRWPSNVVLDGSQADALDEQAGPRTSGSRKAGTHGLMGYMGADAAPMPAIAGGTGGASRFFPTFRYQAKAPTSERPKVNGTTHPTVKPLALMRWLVRLVTPPGGTVLDPFAGSGATVEAAMLEGFDAIGIEREAEYLPLIGVRLERA